MYFGYELITNFSKLKNISRNTESHQPQNLKHKTNQPSFSNFHTRRNKYQTELSLLNVFLFRQQQLPQQD